MFQKALAREVPTEIGTFRRTTVSIRHLQRQRWTFPHRIVLLVYSTRFDPASLDAQQLPGATIDGLPAHEALARKSAAATASCRPRASAPLQQRRANVGGDGHEYAGPYHEILNEVERNAVLARLEGWLACI